MLAGAFRLEIPVDRMNCPLESQLFDDLPMKILMSRCIFPLKSHVFDEFPIKLQSCFLMFWRISRITAPLVSFNLSSSARVCVGLITKGSRMKPLTKRFTCWTISTCDWSSEVPPKDGIYDVIIMGLLYIGYYMNGMILGWLWDI